MSKGPSDEVQASEEDVWTSPSGRPLSTSTWDQSLNMEDPRQEDLGGRPAEPDAAAD